MNLPRLTKPGRKGRAGIAIDMAMLRKCLDTVEKDGALDNESVLWKALAEEYNKVTEEEVSYSVVMLRVKGEKWEKKTKPGRVCKEKEEENPQPSLEAIPDGMVLNLLPNYRVVRTSQNLVTQVLVGENWQDMGYNGRLHNCIGHVLGQLFPSGEPLIDPSKLADVLEEMASCINEGLEKEEGLEAA